MSLQETKLNIENGVGTITIDNPKTFNALTLQVVDEIIHSLSVLESDDSVKVIVITGAGKAFSSGGDIRYFATLLAKGESIPLKGIEDISKLILKIRSIPKPCIAALNGVVAGAGCSLALACDFRIMVDNANFVEAFIDLAVSGDSGNLYFLNKIIGSAKATELMMLGSSVTPKEAEAMGLVTKVVSQESFDDEVNKLSLKLVNGPSFAYAKLKDLTNRINFGQEFQDYLKIEAKHMFDCALSEDFKEAVQSFIEKRKPNFKGK